MSSQYKIAQSEDYKGDDWWQWAVWIEASDEDLDQVEYVEWTLHPTFRNPVRKCDERSTNFRIETGGWGVFPISAHVQTRSGSPIRLRHFLELHYPDGTKTTK
jgi:transcription initiation factor IIF auxiliary subunit